MTAPIDIQHLEQYVFGDRALLDEILTIFIEQATMLVSRFDPTMNEDDWHSTAHTLKGASRGVGAWALGDLAERAEALAHPGAEARRATILAELRNAGAAAVGFAREYRDQKG